MPLFMGLRRGANGFTLLELLIVLALIGIASGFAVASVDKLATRMDERRWQDRTRQTLQAMRNKAIRNGVTVAVEVAVDAAEIRQLNEVGSELLLKLPTNFKYELVSAPGETKAALERKAVIYFFADGAMDGQTFDLVSPQGRRYELKFAKHTGQVRGRLSDAVQ